MNMGADRGVEEGRRRVVIEGVSPEVDCGRFPIKRTVGEGVDVEADAFTDGHDAVRCLVLHRPGDEGEWAEVPMEALPNDRWRGSFTVERLGRHRYTVVGWVDHWVTWRRDIAKKIAAGQDVAVDLLVGADLVAATAARAGGADAETLAAWEATLRGPATDAIAALDEDSELRALMERHPDRSLETRYERELEIVVDPVRARFSAWYELFPRSLGENGAHGTLRDCEAWLPRIADMGFDVLYLPPVHPIGREHRKGRNNATTAEPDDVGSPWAIGAAEGGHKDVHPDLGTVDAVARLARAARAHGIELALDIAFQTAPDHPYVREHAEWFRRRPDGTVQYAENPPKKYQDIYPFDFETEAAGALWEELADVVRFWLDRDVRTFRVDNPHTKPFPFWEWLIDGVKREHPDAVFLSEAFTRPKVMYRLAKLGFTQSYTYFAWRNTKWEITEYFTELTRTAPREFFRPNLWPNTPDILTEHLQTGGRPAFVARLVLAATLGASYGIYGPPYEVLEGRPREPGSEEYLDSEKYQLRSWDVDGPGAIGETIARVNRIRHENPALHGDRSLRFHGIGNDQLICYSKRTDDRSNVILVVCNLDLHHRQSGWTELDLGELGIDAGAGGFQVHDLLGGARYLWHGAHNYVELDPHVLPAHILRVRRRVRTEHDFDYYL
jgi:starch synthase (maltosyl-transferring)